MQRTIWESFQHGLGRETVRREGDGWSYLAIVEHGQMSSRLYCPYGPVTQSDECLGPALEDLRAIAKEKKLEFVRVEPFAQDERDEDKRVKAMLDLGLVRSAKNVQPVDTALIDVAVPPDEIVARAVQNVRNIYRKNLRQGLQFTISFDPADLPDFLDLQRRVYTRANITSYPDSYFETMANTIFSEQGGAGLMYAVLEGRRVASMLFLCDGDVFYYTYAAADDAYKKMSPATSLIMNAQMYAHERGCQLLDFYGIAPEDAAPTHPWQGFTHFKLSFGAQRFHTLGTWELPVNKIRYQAYRLMMKASKH